MREEIEPWLENEGQSTRWFCLSSWHCLVARILGSVPQPRSNLEVSGFVCVLRGLQRVCWVPLVMPLLGVSVHAGPGRGSVTFAAPLPVGARPKANPSYGEADPDKEGFPCPVPRGLWAAISPLTWQTQLHMQLLSRV